MAPTNPRAGPAVPAPPLDLEAASAALDADLARLQAMLDRLEPTVEILARMAAALAAAQTPRA